MSFKPTIHYKLRAISELKENWDSYGARPIDEQCLLAAQTFLRQQRYDWTAVPCADGSIQLERNVGGLNLELHISRAADEGLTGCTKCGAPTFEYHPGAFEFTCDHYKDDDAHGNGKRTADEVSDG
jgi:hypothetical protein